MYIHVDEPPKKKRRSRWGGEESRTIIPGLPTVLPPNLSEEQQKLYLCKIYLYTINLSIYIHVSIYLT